MKHVDAWPGELLGSPWGVDRLLLRQPRTMCDLRILERLYIRQGVLSRHVILEGGPVALNRQPGAEIAGSTRNSPRVVRLGHAIEDAALAKQSLDMVARSEFWWTRIRMGKSPNHR